MIKTLSNSINGENRSVKRDRHQPTDQPICSKVSAITRRRSRKIPRGPRALACGWNNKSAGQSWPMKENPICRCRVFIEEQKVHNLPDDKVFEGKCLADNGASVEQSHRDSPTTPGSLAVFERSHSGPVWPSILEELAAHATNGTSARGGMAFVSGPERRAGG